MLLRLVVVRCGNNLLGEVLSLASIRCGLLSCETLFTQIVLTYVTLPTEVKANSDAIPSSELPSTSCLLCF